MNTRESEHHATLRRLALDIKRRERWRRLGGLVLLAVAVTAMSVLIWLGQGCALDPAADPRGDGGTCWLTGCDDGSTCIDGICVDDYACTPEFCPVRPRPEVCNGLDDDRDGKTDEGPAGLPLARWCTGSACGPGSQLCGGGTWGPCQARGYIEETGALACDGVDNDCDGAIDEHPFMGGDVVFLVDRSGSMSAQLARVTLALDGFAAGLGPDWRFAVVAFPDGGPVWGLWADLAPYADVSPTLALLSSSSVSTAEEPSYDVLLDVGDQSVPLSWRPGAARFVFLITDEYGQSYRDPQITEATACSSFVHGETVVSYTQHQSDFNACGAALHLRDVDDISARLADPCAP